MTEELKQKAEKYRIHFENELYLFDNTDIFPNDIEEAYIAGATEVTKELQEENERLVNDYEMIHNCFLIKENEVKKLEAQIEKMKSCGNCKYCGTPCTHPSEEACEDLDKWELAG